MSEVIIINGIFLMIVAIVMEWRINGYKKKLKDASYDQRDVQDKYNWLRRDAIDRNFAEYNAKTGEWQWREK